MAMFDTEISKLLKLRSVDDAVAIAESIPDGALVDHRDLGGHSCTVLGTLAILGKWKLFSALLATRPLDCRSPIGPEGDPVIHLLSERKRGSELTELLASGVDPNSLNSAGYTALERACMHAKNSRSVFERIRHVLVSAGAEETAWMSALLGEPHARPYPIRTPRGIADFLVGEQLVAIRLPKPDYPPIEQATAIRLDAVNVALDQGDRLDWTSVFNIACFKGHSFLTMIRRRAASDPALAGSVRKAMAEHDFDPAARDFLSRDLGSAR